MPHYGTLQDFSFQNDIDDIRGTEIYGANGEKLGKIHDVIFDHTSGEMKYVVVDAAGWFTHKEFLVAADRVHDYDKDKNAFQVDLTKEHVEHLPKYDAKKVKTENDWADYEAEYKRAWVEDPVLHRKDRIDLEVTPPEVRGERVDERDRGTEQELAREDLAGRFTPTRLAGKFPEAAESSNKIEMVPAAPGETNEEAILPDEFPVEVNPPANPTQQAARADVGQWHPRMKKFEEVLKKNRVDVTASCASCAPGKDRAA